MNSPDLRGQLAAVHPACFGWALACCRGDPARAEDVLQSAYVRVLEGRAVFSERSSFKTWLFGVIRNAAREERRRRLLRRAGLLRYEAPAAPAVVPARQVVQDESCVRLRAALRRLSARQHEVLHLVFYQELTIEEAARVMGVSLGSARTHYERGKRQLRRRLQTGAVDDAP